MTHDNRCRGIIVITGSSGYIGQNLIYMAIKQGWFVRALMRKPTYLNQKQVSYHHYELSEPINPNILQGADAIIHLAALTDGSDKNESIKASIEVNAAKHLLDAAANNSVKNFLFISSQTASATAPSYYGRVKYAIEEQVLAFDGTVIRPGMVYGGCLPGGLYESLSQLIAKLPFIPMLLPASYIQPVAVQDLCWTILDLVNTDKFRGKLFNIAAPIPLRFDIFLKAIARFRYQAWKPTLPVPVIFLKFLLALAELSGFKLKFNRARLASLMNLPYSATAEDWQMLGIQPMSLAAGFFPSGRTRRLLLEEGNAFLRYVTGLPASFGALKHYAKAVEQLDNGQPLLIPYLMIKIPFLLYGYERFARLLGSANKLKRMHYAFTIAETMPTSFQSFWHKEDIHFFKAYFYLAIALFTEILWRLFASILKVLNIGRV